MWKELKKGIEISCTKGGQWEFNLRGKVKVTSFWGKCLLSTQRHCKLKKKVLSYSSEKLEVSCLYKFWEQMKLVLNVLDFVVMSSNYKMHLPVTL